MTSNESVHGSNGSGTSNDVAKVPARVVRTSRAAWVPVLYTATETDEDTEPHDAGAKVTVAARSVMVLQASD